MKQREILKLGIVVVVTAIFSLIISDTLFASPSSRSAKVPVAQAITTTFPDVQNDPDYSSFLNSNALDLTQTIQIGASNNSSPFNNSSQ